MAEFIYWQLGDNTQILINEQAYLDYRTRLEQINTIVSDKIALAQKAQRRGRLSVDGYIGVNAYDKSGNLTQTFLNSTNIEMVISEGSGHPKYTGVLMNYADDFIYTSENAEQISCAGMCYDLHDPKSTKDVEAHERVPHVYECPISPIKVKWEDSETLSHVFSDQIVVIQRDHNQDSDRVVVLSDLINSREQMDGVEIYEARANFSTQKAPHGQMSYIYPSVR